MKREYNTRVNQLITQFITEKSETSFTTQEVFEYLQAEEVDVNLTTVYRNLEKLLKNNRLVKFKSSKSAAVLYRVVDNQSNCHRHLHLQCKQCGKIYHLDGAFMNDIDQYVKNEFNFNIDCENSILTGVCFDCSKR